MVQTDRIKKYGTDGQNKKMAQTDRINNGTDGQNKKWHRRTE